MAVLFDFDPTRLSSQAGWPREYFVPKLISSDGAAASLTGTTARLTTGTLTNYGSQLHISPLTRLSDNTELYLEYISTASALFPDLYLRQGTGSLTMRLPMGPGGSTNIARGGTALTPTVAVNLPVGGLARLRMQFSGALIRARLWPDTVAEPTTWPLRVIDSPGVSRGRFEVVCQGNTVANVFWDVTRLVMKDIAPIDNTESYGVQTSNGTGALTAFVIPHGLGVVPQQFSAIAASVAAATSFYVTADATNLTVTYAVAPATGTGNVVLSWRAVAP